MAHIVLVALLDITIQEVLALSVLETVQVVILEMTVKVAT